MSLEGKAEASSVLRGRINSCDFLTISAYGIAVKNGFNGTEAEWLESLKGDPPIRGTDYWTEDDKQAIASEVLKKLNGETNFAEATVE